MSQVYRPEPRVPGLPLPRRSITTFHSTTLAFGAVAFFVPYLCLWLTRDRTFAAFSESADWGRRGLILLALLSVVPIVIAVRGRVDHGRRSIIHGGLAMLPVFIAAATASWQAMVMDESLPLAFGTAVRQLFAKGSAEVSSLHIFGQLIAACSCLVLALVCASTLGTIARKETPPADRPVLVSLALWFVIAISLAVPGLHVLSLFGTLLTIGIFALLRRGLKQLHDWHDPSETKEHLALALIAALTSLIAVVLLIRTERLMLEANIFREVNLRHPSPLIDPPRDAMVDAFLSYARSIELVNLGFGFVALLLMFVPFLRKRMHPAQKASFIALGLSAAVFVMLFAQENTRAARLRLAKARTFETAPMPRLDSSDVQDLPLTIRRPFAGGEPPRFETHGVPYVFHIDAKGKSRAFFSELGGESESSESSRYPLSWANLREPPQLAIHENVRFETVVEAITARGREPKGVPFSLMIGIRAKKESESEGLDRLVPRLHEALSLPFYLGEPTEMVKRTYTDSDSDPQKAPAIVIDALFDAESLWITAPTSLGYEHDSVVLSRPTGFRPTSEAEAEMLRRFAKSRLPGVMQLKVRSPVTVGALTTPIIVLLSLFQDAKRNPLTLFIRIAE